MKEKIGSLIVILLILFWGAHPVTAQKVGITVQGETSLALFAGVAVLLLGLGVYLFGGE